MRAFLILSVAFLLAACEGPMGPEGPRGPEGEPGPGTRLTFNGRVDSEGSAFVDLPDEAGSLSALPVVSCFMSSNPDGPFLVIATDTYSGVGCGVGEDNIGMYVAIVGAPSLWYYRITVVY